MRHPWLPIRWRLIAAVVVALVRLARWRIDVQGLRHVPSEGGAVLAFNHHSYGDFIMLGWAPVRLLRRPIRFLAKREIWDSPRTRWIVDLVGAVPVDRHSASDRSSAYEAAIAALQDGDLVAVAPEQTISRSFELLPFRTGAARMAQQAGVPIVPVVGWGSHRFATKGHKPRLITGLPVSVRFGEPIEVGPDDDPREATDRLRARMTEMLHHVQETYPDGAPAGEHWVPARLGGGAPPPDDQPEEGES
jgi:1-acyl-sn-glycerol-3-phosphate acyltransferase